MTRKAWKRISGAALLFGVLFPVGTGCAAMGKITAAAGLPDVKCPEGMGKAEVVADLDFAKEFQLKGEGAVSLKAATVAALEIKAFAEGIDADLKLGCGKLANDLGVAGEFKGGKEACEAAVKAVGDTKAKLGANAKLDVKADPISCGVDQKAFLDCAMKCQPDLGASAKVECSGSVSGSCSGKCSGACEMSAAAKCDGTCKGTCEGKISGKCDGKCEGKCDGKTTAKGGATCAGKCDGKCDAQVESKCDGKCGGSCQMSGGGECKGTCSGGCQGEVKEPKCSGDVTIPKLNPNCFGQCGAAMLLKIQCQPPKVKVNIVGAADAEAAAKLKAAIEANAGPILKVAIGTGAKAGGLVKAGADLAMNAKGSIAAVASSPMIAAKVTACIAPELLAAIDMAAGIKANIDVSVNVNASFAAGGSAGAGTK